VDDGRLGLGRTSQSASIGDLVICIDAARVDAHGHVRRFIGLVLDKSITVYKIQVVDSGKEIYWPMSATYLWKETQ
jgi:DNA-binding cell septation regulator SpoVG